MTRFQTRWCRFRIAEFEQAATIAYCCETILHCAWFHGWAATRERFQSIRGYVLRLSESLAEHERRCRHDWFATLRLLEQTYAADNPRLSPWVVAMDLSRSEILVPRVFVSELRELLSETDQFCLQVREPTIDEVITRRTKFSVWRGCVEVDEESNL